MGTPEIRRRKSPVDARAERQIVTGMIVSDRFLREVQPLCSPDGFQVDFSRRIAQWCLDYHGRYGKSPGRHIEDLYLQHKGEVEEEDAALIESFLSGISEEYERSEGFNVEYILDKAEQHFRLNALRNLERKIQAAVVSGNPEEGEAAAKEYRRPARPSSQGIDPLRDVDFIVGALAPEEDNPDVIIRLPGELGEAAGPLERGFFVAVQAESGVGKTQWLWWMAQLCVFAGYDTAFFSMEMAEKKMGVRLWQSVAGAPSLVVPDLRLGGDGQMLMPVFDCARNQTNDCRETCGVALLDGEGRRPAFRDAPRGYAPCSRCRGRREFEPASWWREAGRRELLDPGIALSKHAQLERTGMLKRAGKFHLVEFPSRRRTMEDLLAYLNNLEYYEDFVPSVIITDYADKLKWGVPNDPRVSIAEIWGEHKGLAQERHCLVITASQSNTMRSGKQVGRGSWAETQEKHHLLELAIALNQSASDQAAGVMWASMAKIRNGQPMRTEEVMVLQQLSIGRPYVDSCRVIRKGQE